MSPTPSTPIFSVGLHIHRDSFTAAVFKDREPQPCRVDRLPNDLGNFHLDTMEGTGLPRES